jgi:hypothetical protein
MHSLASLARSAGYPSISSRAARQQSRADSDAASGRRPAALRLRRQSTPPPPPPVPAAQRPGGAARCARPGAGPGGNPPQPHPAAAAGPGAVPHRHRSWAAAAARYSFPGGGPRGPPDCATRCELPGRHSGLQGGGSPDCIANRRAGRHTPGRGRWGQPGPGPPWGYRRGRCSL